jgi:hypothetical protein
VAIDIVLGLTAEEAAFLAARLRRLFKHFGYPVPECNDSHLIRIAGSCIGGLLTREAKGHAGVGEVPRG